MSSVRCHYVPQFYLNYFLQPGTNLFWVYDKKDKSTRQQPPVNTAVIGDYYLSSKDQDGHKDKSIENLLSRIESDTKPILDKWLHHPTQWDESERDKQIITTFLAFSCCRVPRTVEDIKEMHRAGIDYVADESKKIALDPIKLKKNYEGFCNFSKDKNIKISFEEFSQIMADPLKNVKVSINEKYALGVSLNLAQIVHAELTRMNWHLCITKGKHFFITSDTPITVFAPLAEGKAIFGGGFRLPQAEVTFPLSPKVCLLLNHKSHDKYEEVSSDFVDCINERTTYMAERWIISPYKSNRIQKMVIQYSSNYKIPRIDSEFIKASFSRKEGLEG